VAKIWYKDNQIVRFLWGDAEEIEGPPALYDGEIDFDMETNQDVVNSLNTDWDGHDVVAGKLRYQGVVLPINPPEQFYVDHQAVKQFYQDLNNEIDWLGTQISNWDGLTGAQKQAWITNNFDRILGEVQKILKFIRWLIKKIKLFL
jgi:hypothetical protein